MVFLPVFVAMFGGVVLWGLFAGRRSLGSCSPITPALLMALAWCFLGLGMLLSTLARSRTWPRARPSSSGSTLFLFLDLMLLGVMIRN